MATFEIKAKNKDMGRFWSLQETAKWIMEAESEEEVLAYLENRTFRGLTSSDYEITRIIREPTRCVSHRELCERVQKAADEKAKQDRRAVYERLKAEFEVAP